MAKTVKFYDTYQILPTCVQKLTDSIRDNYSLGDERSLIVTIAATHAGKPTRNHGLYLPSKMRDSCHTWLEPFAKPFLLHHNEYKDPIGRVIGANYIDTSSNIPHQDKASWNSAIEKICDAATPFHRVVDLVDDLLETDLIKNPNFAGLGHIVLKTSISDQDAIKKFLDERYFTVSVGAYSDHAICSICKQDWVEDAGRCEHIPGKVYDGKTCLLIAGSFIYDEVSVVNAPADSLARVISISNGNGLVDSVLVDENPYITDAAAYQVQASFGFQDMTRSQDKLILGGSNPMEKLKEAWEKALELANDEAKTQDERVKALNDFLAEFKDATDNPYRQQAEDLLAKLQLADKHVEDNTASMPEEIDDAILEEATQHYNDMIELGYTLGLLDDDFEDAKLSPKARKAMKKSTFCKPAARKYPVPDCNHARVAMAYAKKNNESSAVIACIRRKAKALGCPFSAKKSDSANELTSMSWDDFEKELDEILADETKRSTKKTDSIKDDKTPCKSCEALQDELKIQQDQLKALRQELKDIYTEAQEDEAAYTNALGTLRTVLADALTRLGAISKQEIKDFDKTVSDTASMKIEDLVRRASELQQTLDLDATIEKLSDGMSRIPEGSVDNPTLKDKNDNQDKTNPEDDKHEPEDEFSRIREAWNRINQRDPSEADEYLMKLKNALLVPRDFDPRA